MKNTTILTGLSLFFLVFCACGDSNEEPTLPTSIALTPSSVILPGGSGSAQTVTVTTTADWSAVSNANWLSATKESATVLRVATTSANTESADRQTTVVVSGGGATATLNVTQNKLVVQMNDSLALVALYNATAGASWTKKWTLTTPLSQWNGVTVTNKRVTHLDLRNNNLTGALPTEINILTELQRLDVTENQLSGALPSGINSLTKLDYLDLSYNQLSGAIPALNNLTNLQVLDLGDNNFTALPPSLSPLVKLGYLALCKNNLSGSLPADWKNLAELNYLDVGGNNFTGSIPLEWSTLTKMQAFWLYNNGLSGTIPNYFTNFSHLMSLALDGNNLTEGIPSSLGDIITLQELRLAYNRLGGSIPASLLANSKWATWEPDVCPQQTGPAYGFDNCNSSGSPVQTRSTVKRDLRWAKELYRK